MNSVAFVSPILPGKLGTFLEFVHTLNVTRRDEFEAQQKRLGLTYNQIWLHKLPQGDFALIVQQGEDIRQSARIIRFSTEPFDVWFRQQILDIHGRDITQPVRGPRSQLCVDYRAPVHTVTPPGQ